MGNLLSTTLIISFISPIIGSFFGVIKKPKPNVVAHLFAFSAGIMISISFLDLIPQSLEYGSLSSCIYGLIIGSLIIYLIDLLFKNNSTDNDSTKTLSLLLATSIGLHNICEGMAVAIGSMLDKKLSFVIIAGIAIHNIAEGICTAAPLYYSYKNKYLAFFISSLTALPLLIGYLLVYYFFRNSSELFFSFLLAITAGLMIYISCSELIPYSTKSSNTSIYSLILGIILVLLLQNVS